MEEIEKMQIQALEKHDKILGQIELNEKDLNEIEDLIAQDNTNQKIILTYLRLYSKFKNESLEDKLKKFEFFISKNDMNTEFGSYYTKMFSSAEIFELLMKKILSFSPESSFIEKLCFYLELTKLDINYYDIKGKVDYKNNKELSLIILVNNIRLGIEENIKNIKDINENLDNEVVSKFRKKIEESKAFKKVEEFLSKKSQEIPTQEEINIYNDKKKKDNKFDADATIKKYTEEIIFNSKIESESFSKYFDNFKDFLKNTKNNFLERFNDIENLSDENFKLFQYYCLFLCCYDFRNLSPFYINKWNNTFTQTEEDIEEALKYYSKEKGYKYEIYNNELHLRICDYDKEEINIQIVKNINDYSIDCLIDYFSPKATFRSTKPKRVIKIKDTTKFKEKEYQIDDFFLEKYLKFDCCEKLYINRVKKVWEEHLRSIFTSTTIKSAFNALCKVLYKDFTPYNFLNDKDLEKIFQNCRYFQFPANMLGFTEPFYLFDYEFYGGLNEKFGECCSKLINLSMNQVTKEHEILGHINIRIQKYLSKKEINSPLIDSSNYLDEKFKKNESGEYLEKLLYGSVLVQLTYNQILFILDKENYLVNYIQFRENFNKCNNKLYKPSKSLNNLLVSLNININRECNYLGYISINENLVNKSDSKDAKISYGARHTHLHPKKIVGEADRVIDEIYQNVLKMKNNPNH